MKHEAMTDGSFGSYTLEGISASTIRICPLIWFDVVFVVILRKSSCIRVLEFGCS
jgi:hypothetical protein